MSNTNNRVIHFDILRIIAALAVIMIHVSAQYLHSIDINSPEYNAVNFWDSLSRWAVPIFIMISGALFLSEDRPISTIYRKYILRIVTAFAFWSLFYASLYYIKNRDLIGALKNFITGNYHMWFLYMIIGLYMLIPILRPVASNPLVCKYFLILSFIFGLVIPEIINILNLFNTDWSATLGQVNYNIGVSLITGYSFYFLLGYYLHNNIKNINPRLICFIGVIGFLSTVIGSMVSSSYQNTVSEIFYDYLTANVLFESVIIFYFIYRIIVNISFLDAHTHLISKLSKYTFGIYLVHPFFIRILRSVHNPLENFNMFIYLPLTGVIIFILSLIASSVLNHIPILKKYIV